jgi:hypothetical protein
MNHTTVGFTPMRTMSPAAITIDPFEGYSNITRPPATLTRINTMAELIDPNEVTASSHVRSPSGQLLSRDIWINRPDRPASIRER